MSVTKAIFIVQKIALKSLNRSESIHKTMFDKLVFTAIVIAAIVVVVYFLSR